MERSRLGRAVELIPALGFVLTATVASVFIFSLPALRQSALRLSGSLASPLALVLLLLPLAAGAFLLVRGRRFWAWPFVYLTALFVAFSGLLSSESSNSVDIAFEYARITLLSITVLVAELVGLSAGRLFHRLAAVAYFAGASIWLLLAAIERAGGTVPLAWRCAVLLSAAGGFLLQAAIQLGKYLARQRALRQGWYFPDEEAEDYSEGWDEEDASALPAPQPTVNADALPWKVVIGEESPQFGKPAQSEENPLPGADGLPEKG